MKIVVTGAAGFIGSCLVAELNEQGYTDLILVDHEKNIEQWPNLKNYQFTKYILAQDLYKDVDFSEINCIFHMGACSSTTETNWEYLKENNLEFSKKIFETATKNNIVLIYASSAATYGDGENGYSDSHQNTDKLLPLNLYGRSKHEFDLWALEQKETPLFWAGLKFFNVYGPNEYHKGPMRSIVHKAFEQIREHGVVNLFKSYREGFEDGQQLRDFIYVKDVVRAMIEMMKVSNPKFNGLYNLGTGKARSFFDLVKATFKALDKEENINFIEMPKEIRNQYQYYTQAEMDKFKNILPDFSFHGLEEGVEDYVKNFLKKDDPFY
ncbi:MAG: ADP-glyceromanno-heptose 6-epimerase [Bdellovibrionales bacterium]|nr:ADP-glyceromanno-heptose 6-epimerase [Bdellovibrionales bacterium]